MKKQVATLVRKLEGWTGDARLYRLSHPLESHEYVIVSAVIAPYSGPETYIFPSRANGEPVNYRELDGSFRGALDHDEALRNAGYSVASQSRRSE